MGQGRFSGRKRKSRNLRVAAFLHLKIHTTHCRGRLLQGIALVYEGSVPSTTFNALRASIQLHQRRMPCTQRIAIFDRRENRLVPWQGQFMQVRPLGWNASTLRQLLPTACWHRFASKSLCVASAMRLWKSRSGCNSASGSARLPCVGRLHRWRRCPRRWRTARRGLRQPVR